MINGNPVVLFPSTHLGHDVTFISKWAFTRAANVDVVAREVVQEETTHGEQK